MVRPPYVYYTLYTIHYTLYTIHYTLYTVYYILYTIPNILVHTERPVKCVNAIGRVYNREFTKGF